MPESYDDTTLRQIQYTHQWPLPEPVILAGDQRIHDRKIFDDAEILGPAVVFANGMVGDNATDSRSALLDAMNEVAYAAHHGRGIVLIPPADSGYYLSSGIDLSANVYAGVTVLAPGGWNDTQHGPPPSVKLRSGSGPVFFGANYSHMAFGGLSFFAPAGSPAFAGDYSYRCKFTECSATSTGAAPAWKFENSFWHQWQGGRSLSDTGQRTFDFITKNTTPTSLEVISGNMRWTQHIFQLGNVRLYQTATAGFTQFAGFTFRDCVTESFVAPEAWVDLQTAGGATACLAESISFGGEMADNTGAVAAINVGPNATARYIDFAMLRAANAAYWTLEAGAQIYGIGGAGGVGSHNIAQDTPYSGGHAVRNYAGHDIRNPDASFGPAVAGAAAGGTGTRYFRDAEAYARYTLSDYGLQAGPGSGAFDSLAQRGGAGFFAVPMLVKAGAPVDGDFATAPPNGTLAINTTTPQIYCRIGGVWTAV